MQSLAERWIQGGAAEQSISRAMLTIDYTPEVADEARESKCDVIIAYHPPIFEAIKRVTSSSPIL